MDTTGCPENRFDVAQTREALERMGISFTKNPEEADTIILNTCGLTNDMEQISVNMLRKLRQSALPGSRILVTGCLPKINPDSLQEFNDVTVIKGPLMESFPWDSGGDVDLKEVFSPCLHPQRILYTDQKFPRFDRGFFWNLDRLLYQRIGICPPNRKRFFIKIATGCNQLCTYCAVRISRGELRSREVEWVVARFRQGLAAGYHEFALIGTNVSAYGQDIGTNLCQLLKLLIQHEGEYTIQLRNLEPEDVIRFLPEFLDVLRSGRISYMEFPLQSGSDRILKLMARTYHIDEYVEAMKEIKRVCPDILIRSQVMVAFPTETEEEFKQTLKVAGELPFIFIEPFCFSSRPGTAASRLEGHISRKVAKRRYKELREHLMHSHLGYKLKTLAGMWIKSKLGVHPKPVVRENK